MDRTEEMMELVARMVTILMEERSQMRCEIERINLTLKDMQESISSLQRVPESKVSEPQPDISEPQVIEMADISLDESDFNFEPEPEPESEPEPEPEPEPESEPESEPGSPVIEPFEEHEPEFEFNYEPETESEPEPEPEPEPDIDTDTGVLKPRDREEQINDKSEWGMFYGSHIDDAIDGPDDEESVIGNLMDFQEEPAEPAWMTDYPGLHVDSVYEALSNSDRILFIRELFDEDGEQFTLSLDRIDECPDFGQVVKEMRIAFPEWDESSDVVYQFYMLIRRRFV